MRESNPRCRIESPASWTTRRMRRSASGACRSRSPAFRRRWSRPRAEALEARRGVEPRSTVLQTVLLPEQRAVGAGSGNRTRAVGLADRHSTFEPYLRGSGVPESNRACCVGSAVVRLEQTPRRWADARFVTRGTDNEARRRPGAAARNRTVPDRVPSDCSTLELRRQDWWSRRVPPPENLLARQARGLPHDPVIGEARASPAGRRGIEPRPAGLESARPPWPPT